jgi:hypothetical protein
VHRGQESKGSNQAYWLTLGLYVFSTAVGGAATGALLGAAGSLADSDARAAAAAGSALVAIGLAMLGLTRGPMTPAQCDRETPKSWIDRGPAWWALQNGLTLGCGATTRIGFMLWYVIPLAAVVSGSAAAGAIVFAAYGFTRGLGALGLTVAARRHRFEQVSVELLRLRHEAQFVTTAVLLSTGIAGAVGMGL